MAKQVLNNGETGLVIRTKINENFTELYEGKVDNVSGKGLSTEDYTTAEKNKLSGIAAGATTNDTDAQLRDRATHTGTQPVSTITGLGTAYAVEPRISVKPTLSTQFGESNTVYDGKEFVTEPVEDTYTVTRASTATYTDATGKIRTAAINEPRYTFDPETGEALGLLVEEQRTNLLTWSEDFTNTAWSKLSSVVVNPTTLPSPIANKNWQKFVSGTSDSVAQAIRQTGTTNETMSFSLLVKQAEVRYVMIRVNAGLDLRITIDLEDASLGNTLNFTGSHSFKKFNDGSILFSFTQSGFTAGNFNREIWLKSSANAGSGGDVVNIGDGVYLGFAQLEAASTPSSYISTQASAVTRAADNVSRVLGSEWNPNEGTWFIEFVLTQQQVSGAINILSPSTTANQRLLYKFGSSSFRIFDGGALSSVDIGVSFTVGARYKAAVVVKNNNYQVFAQGLAGSIAAHTGIFLDPSVMQQIIFSSGANKKTSVKDFRYYPKALSEAEALALTKVS